jgi:hypothetical protein
MKKLILFLVLIMPFVAKSQQQSAPEMGSTRYLDFKKSYKSIKLGSNISTLTSNYLSKTSESADENSCYLYNYSDPAALNFGNGVQLKKIKLRVFGDMIVSIYLFFDSADGNKVKEIFTTAYGKNYSQSNSSLDRYLWLGSLTDVYLSYSDDDKVGAAIYNDSILDQAIKKGSKASASKAASDL